MAINWANTVDIFVQPQTIVTSSSHRDTLTLQETLDAFAPTRGSETRMTLATFVDTHVAFTSRDVVTLQWHETNDWRMELWSYARAVEGSTSRAHICDPRAVGAQAGEGSTIMHGYAIIFGRTLGRAGPFFVYSHHRGNVYRQLTTRMCVCEEDDGPMVVPSGDIDALKAHIKMLL